MGLLALIAVLIARSPWFGFFTLFGVMVAVQYLAGVWRGISCSVAAVLIAMSQSGGFHRPTLAW